MAYPLLQKQSSRYCVLSAAAQLAYNEVMADAALTQVQRIDPSSVFQKKPSNRTDKGMVGKANEFATNDQITAWDTDGTLKSDADAWLLGYALSLIFGVDLSTPSGGLYLHNYAMPAITVVMPATNVYFQETAAVACKYQDMSAKSLSIDIPERGACQLSLDMVGTGRWNEAPMAAVPAILQPAYLLGSDVGISITPTAGALVGFSGRIRGASIKIDRGTYPFQSSGDGLFAGCNVAGDPKFSVDLTLAALSTDDVNGWFEGGTRCAVTIATNPALAVGFGFSFPSIRFKANKLGQSNGITTWGLSFDETSSIISGATAAINAFLTNSVAAYLLPV